MTSKKAELSKDDIKYIENLYHDIKFSGSFSSAETFYRAQKDIEKKFTLEQIKSVLKNLKIHQEYKKNLIVFPKRHIRAYGSMISLEADLGFLKKFKHYTCFLCVVDQFSYFVKLVPLTSKSSENVKKAFVKIFKDARFFKVSYLRTDGGMFSCLPLTKKDIKHFYANISGTEFASNRQFFHDNHIKWERASGNYIFKTDKHSF